MALIRTSSRIHFLPWAKELGTSEVLVEDLIDMDNSLCKSAL